MYFVKGLNYPVTVSGDVAVLGNEVLGKKEVYISDYSPKNDIFDYMLEKSKTYELSEHEASALYYTLKAA